MAHTSVLAIGIDPAFADFTAFPHLTPELVRNYIDAQIEQLRTENTRLQNRLAALEVAVARLSNH